MQTLLQLNPPIPMKTPRGEGMAVMVIDYGPDFDLWWTVILTKGEHAGEIWTYSNPEVRGVENISLGRQVQAIAKQNGLHHPNGSGNGNGMGGRMNPEPMAKPHPGNPVSLEQHDDRQSPPPSRGV